MWIPGHCRIAGNDYADLNAKIVQQMPTFLSSIIEKNQKLKKQF